MTVSDMHTAFLLNLDKSSSLAGNPDFLPEEIDYWLNEAQDRFIKQRMFGTNYRKEKYDDTQKRRDDLRTLITTNLGIFLNNPSSLGTNVKYCILPTTLTTSPYPYMYYLDSNVIDINGNRLECGKMVKNEYIHEYLKDYINDPYLRRPLTYLYTEGTNHVLGFIYSDEFIPVQCDLTYLRQPMQLTLGPVTGYQTNQCELALETHEEIVNIAVGLVIENIESSRVQTFVPLNQSNIE